MWSFSDVPEDALVLASGCSLEHTQDIKYKARMHLNSILIKKTNFLLVVFRAIRVKYTSHLLKCNNRLKKTNILWCVHVIQGQRVTLGVWVVWAWSDSFRPALGPWPCQRCVTSSWFMAPGAPLSLFLFGPQCFPRESGERQHSTPPDSTSTSRHHSAAFSWLSCATISGQVGGSGP